MRAIHESGGDIMNNLNVETYKAQIRKITKDAVEGGVPVWDVAEALCDITKELYSTPYEIWIQEKDVK